MLIALVFDGLGVSDPLCSVLDSLVAEWAWYGEDDNDELIVWTLRRLATIPD